MSEPKNSNNNLISIIVPVYNTKKYLDRCLSSILNQTYPNIEIILVDDGSTDGSGELCDQYANKYSKIKVIHKKNEGLSAARQTGINIANGECVGFVDSDDWVDKKMFEVLFDNLVKDDAQIACCGIAKVDDLGHREFFNDNIHEKLVCNTEEALIELTFNKKITNSFCDKLYKKNIFDEIQLSCNRIYEDLLVQPQCISAAQKISYTGEPLYFYYMTPRSITRGQFEIKQYDTIVNSKEVIKYYETKYPNIAFYAKAREISLSIEIIYQSLGNSQWDELRSTIINELKQPIDNNIKSVLTKEDKIKLILIRHNMWLFSKIMKIKRQH